MTDAPRIAVLGAGITGLALAERLVSQFGKRVVVLEREHYVGGLAATLSLGDISFDFGSHRLHGDSGAVVFNYIEHILGVPLLKRKRGGKMYFQGTCMSYPPRAMEIMRSFPPAKLVTFFFRYLSGKMPVINAEEISFEKRMVQVVGRELYDFFYRDYATKLWGVPPAQISEDGMKRRKALFSAGALLKQSHAKQRYYLYPAYGIGSLAERLKERIVAHGGEVRTGIRDIHIDHIGSYVRGIEITDGAGCKGYMETAALVSTIPIDDLYTKVFDREAHSHLRLAWRGLRLLYVHIEEEVPGLTETYYFPSSNVLFGRVSRIQQYSPRMNTSLKGTLFTIEIASTPGDTVWEMSEEELLQRCLHDLVHVGILKKMPTVLTYFSFRMDKVYPVYMLGWREKFFAMYFALEALKNVYTVGRKGLFLHCNIDHCILQALALSDFIGSGKDDRKSLWEPQVERFFEFSARY